MNRPRVVVTGLGCVTPAGNDVASTWESLLAGKSAVRTVELLRQEKCPTTIGAPVMNFDPSGIKVRTDVGRIGRASQFALSAAAAAWEDAGLARAKPDPTRLGAIVGTGVGDMAETFRQTQVFLEKGVRGVHPLFATKVMPNATAGLL